MIRATTVTSREHVFVTIAVIRWNRKRLRTSTDSSELHKGKITTMSKNPSTGQKAPKSGIYQPTNGGKEIAVSQGDTLPPAKGEGTGYKLVRPTK